MNLKKLSFVIVTHVYATGPAFRLEDYLQKKVKDLVFIGHPFSYTNDNRSFVRKYKNGKLIKEEKFIFWKGPEIFFWIKDFFLTLYWMIKETKRVDYFVGVDNLNTFSGYVLKLLRRVKKIIFYTIDYIPNRFDNKFLNSFYHFLDRLAVRESSVVWNLSSIMAEEREKRGINNKYREKQIVVPIGTNIPKEKISEEKRDKNKIVFMGHLRSGQGIELLLEAMSLVIKKISSAHLLIIGGGPLEEKLKKMVKIKKLGKNVSFSGFIKEYSEVESLLKSASISIAPYINSKRSYTQYTDPGKPKDYLAVGLPVIITKVPQIAYEIEKNKCGLAINYDKKELAEAIIKLLTNRNLLSEFRKNSLKMAQKYTWDKIFNKAIKISLSQNE